MKTDNHNHEQCKELFARLSEYIDNELNEPDCDQIRQHLENCGCCQSCIETLKKTIELCSSIEENPIPEDLSKKLRQIAATQ